MRNSVKVIKRMSYLNTPALPVVRLGTWIARSVLASALVLVGCNTPAPRTEGNRAAMERAGVYRGPLILGEHELVATESTRAAMALLERAARNHPRDPAPWSELGRFMVLVQDHRPPREAVEVLRRAVALGDHSALTVGALGVSLFVAARPGEAVEPLQRAARLEPQIAGHAFNLGHALLAERRYEEAIVAFTNATSLEPENVRMAIALGEALLQADPPPPRQGERAVTCFEKATRLAPKSAWAHAELAFARIATGDLQGAVEAATLATRLDPRLGLIWISVAVAAARVSQLAEVRVSLQHAAAYNPDDPRVVEMWEWLSQAESSLRAP